MEDILSDASFNLTCDDQSGELARNTSVELDVTINFVFNGLGLLLLAVVGVTVNVLSVIVLSHRGLKSSLTTLLLGLTIADTVVISTSFLIFSLSTIVEKVDMFSWYVDIGRPYLLPWLLPIALIAQMISVYFTVVITLERYIAVCQPLQARSICTRKAAKWSSFTIVLISVLYNIPRWFEFQVRPKTLDCHTGEIMAYTEEETELRKNHFFITYYVNWAYLVTMYIIPFTILLHFNAAIYRQTKIHRNIRNALSPSATHAKTSMSEDIQLAGMLFGIVITFIACNMLSVIINLIEHLGMNDLIGKLIPISNFLIVLGCSSNFIFYCAFGTQFRRRLRRTLRLSTSRKGSSTKSELWSEKDIGIPTRERLRSLQIPSSLEARSRSNSNCGGNNNHAKSSTNNDSGVCAFQTPSGTGNRMQQQNSSHNPAEAINFRESTATVITVVSDEL